MSREQIQRQKGTNCTLTYTALNIDKLKLLGNTLDMDNPTRKCLLEDKLVPEEKWESGRERLRLDVKPKEAD